MQLLQGITDISNSILTVTKCFKIFTTSSYKLTCIIPNSFNKSSFIFIFSTTTPATRPTPRCATTSAPACPSWSRGQSVRSRRTTTLTTGAVYPPLTFMMPIFYNRHNKQFSKWFMMIMKSHAGIIYHTSLQTKLQSTKIYPKLRV